jgi:phosphoribosylanthranilate isomerase
MTPLFEGPPRTRIKFCGITNPHESTLAFEAGAEAIGAILAPSPRQIDLRMAGLLAKTAPPSATLVAVVGDDLSLVPRLCDLGFTMQFAGPIDALRANRLVKGAAYFRVVRLVAFDDAEVNPTVARGEIPVFDTADGERLGGSGRPFRWKRIANVAAGAAVIVAGGLDSTNVAACVRMVRPFGVDVRSGIETAGRKSIAKMRAFVCAVREADAAFAS